MFAHVELARRIERAEASLSSDIGEAALASGRVASAFVESIGDGVAVFAGPGSPINKIIGVGFAGAPDAVRLAEIEALFAGRGSPVQAEVATLADPSWHAIFAPRGYALSGFEHVLGLALAESVPAPAEQAAAPVGLTIVECTHADKAAWLDAVATGFEHPDDVPAQAAGQEYPRDAVERAFEDVASSRGFRRYLAYVDGVVAGGASLREYEGVAQLCGAATLPRFRRRGVQSALVDARLRDARRRGCDIAVITASPGSKSQQNSQRRGFALLYARALHIRLL